ncbi:MAG: N-formylglutamate amidohydrolase [Rhizobiales bacterium]|nr:N-formylglutamate amidohydrolase [Hyphomicrobiales bacterium]NRB14746.1 N-formylglutamate amidohydrolase [Hyphomicrobiales bacterium]
MKNNDNLSHDAFEIIDGDFGHGLLLLADHASAFMPSKYKQLGLDADQLSRHIAYDIGVQEFTIKLAKKLNIPAILGRFSRLLIDPNRGLADPTLVMRVADGKIIPGNKTIDEAGKMQRIAEFYTPYNDAVGQIIASFDEFKVKPSLFAIHSFTPFWRGHKRPTEVGLLWHQDRELTSRIAVALKQNTDYVVHENQPYSGGLVGDTMDRHGLDKQLEHSLLELRQDYVATSSGVDEWVDIFANILPHAVKTYKKN